jgi:ferric-dicitrate binding protein FerR (iron transport regulator)
MGFGRRTSRHVAREVLHAYSAGELDPTQRVVVERHLDACGRCAVALAEADALRAVLIAAEPPPLDDLAWQRMQRRVRAELESRASLSAMRVGGAREWLGVALASTAAAVALVVWFTPFTPKSKAASAGASPSDERLELVVGRGVVVRADRGARVRVVDVDPSAVRLVLDEGRVAVRMAPELDTTLALDARGGLLSARGAMFTLAVVGARAELDVGKGSVEFTQAGVRRVLQDGQLWGWTEEAPVGGAGAAEPHGAAADAPGAPVEAEVGQADAIASDAPAAPAADAPATPPTSAPVVPRRAPARVAADPAPEASVAAVAAPEAIRDARGTFEAAQRAFDEGEVARALTLARAVPRDDDLWAPRAVGLECRAGILVGEYTRAVEACQRVLQGELEPVERRYAHLTLAQLYRTQLGDCARALPHFDAASVRGEKSLLQEEVLLGRCDCRIRAGNLDGATRDVAQLELRGAAFTRPQVLEALKLELQRARAAEGLR